MKTYLDKNQLWITRGKGVSASPTRIPPADAARIATTIRNVMNQKEPATKLNVWHFDDDMFTFEWLPEEREAIITITRGDDEAYYATEHDMHEFCTYLDLHAYTRGYDGMAS